MHKIYKTDKAKAWRNLIVESINEGLERGLFSLSSDCEPYNDTEHGSFEFDLSGYKVTARYYNIGWHELAIEPTVWEEGRIAAAATGWLERDGKYVRYKFHQWFKSRKHVKYTLASVDVEPLGYKDYGKHEFDYWKP